MVEDEMLAIYHAPRRYSVRKCVMWVVAGIVATLLLAYPVKAQQAREGQLVDAMTSICDTRAEADALLTAMSQGGLPAAQAYVAEAGNSCTVQQATFKVGSVYGEVKKDPSGNAWVVIGISDPGETRHDFSVVRANALAALSSI